MSRGRACPLRRSNTRVGEAGVESIAEPIGPFLVIGVHVSISFEGVLLAGRCSPKYGSIRNKTYKYLGDEIVLLFRLRNLVNPQIAHHNPEGETHLGL